MTDLQYHSGRPSNYRLSGLISPKAFYFGMPACLLLSALIGFAAGIVEFLCHILRLIYISLIGESLPSSWPPEHLSVYSVPSLLFKASGSRSRIFNIFCTLACALVALYFAWAGWLRQLCFLFPSHRVSFQI